MLSLGSSFCEKRPNGVKDCIGEKQDFNTFVQQRQGLRGFSNLPILFELQGYFWA